MEKKPRQLKEGQRIRFTRKMPVRYEGVVKKTQGASGSAIVEVTGAVAPDGAGSSVLVHGWEAE